MKIVVFWHNYLVNDWRDVISDQFKTLYQSGLYDAADKVYCGVVGLQYCLDEYQVFIKDLVASYTTNNKIEIRTSTENAFEYLTINWLKEYCDANDAYVLYFHTKGISSPMYSSARIMAMDWRKVMEYFNIIKWEDCVKKLDEGFLCCGICYVRRKYFLGNFWWATSNHIKTLARVLGKGEKMCKRKISRFYYEKWLFFYKTYNRIRRPRVYCFFAPFKYRGQRRMLPEEYVKENKNA